MELERVGRSWCTAGEGWEELVYREGGEELHSAPRIAKSGNKSIKPV